jgi:hypothetical protein
VLRAQPSLLQILLSTLDALIYKVGKCFVFLAHLVGITPFLIGKAAPEALTRVLITGHAALHLQIVLVERQHAVLVVMNAPVVHLVGIIPFLIGKAVPKALTHVLTTGHAVLHLQIVLVERQHAVLVVMNVLVVQKIVRP